MPSMLLSALWYAKQGYSVIPVKGKSEHLIKWKPYQERRATEDEIKAWWGKWPEAGVGIVTGKVSNLLVVDVDSEQAWCSIQDHIPEQYVCPIARTPRGGYHLWFVHEDGFTNKAGYLPNVDVRTTGGFIMAPPSVNGKGVYAWQDGCKIGATRLLPIPSLLKKLLLDPNKIIIGNLPKTGAELSKTKQNLAELSNDKAELSSDSGLLSSLDFGPGKRDDSLFHLANLMIKGGATIQEADQVLKIVMDTWGEGHLAKWRMDKILSAKDRQKTAGRNITQELREWILLSSDKFLLSSAFQCLDLLSRKDRMTAYVAMNKFVAEGLVERVGNQRGVYRTVDQTKQEMDWINADMNYRKFWLPLDLDQMFGALPGNILIFAGAKDSGKTAWLLNIAQQNSHWYQTHYHNSEMGEAEFRLRASKMPEPITELARRIKVYNHPCDIEDKIIPGEGNLNIVDFLEITTDFWRVAETIKRIHEKLCGALCVIAMQKAPNVELGRGGSFSMEKARLYVSLDYGKAKVISCKNFKPDSPVGNPRGYVCEYKLVDGCRIMKQPPGWHTEG